MMLDYWEPDSAGTLPCGTPLEGTYYDAVAKTT